MPRRNEYHASREEAHEDAFGRLGEPFGCPHCLTSTADAATPLPNYQPQLLIVVKDLIRASRILAAPEEVPAELLRSIRNAETFLQSIEEGDDL